VEPDKGEKSLFEIGTQTTPEPMQFHAMHGQMWDTKKMAIGRP
jgi:hypothetical protein